MSQQIYFLTGNNFKIKTARLAMEPFDIDLKPIELDIPEIQADTNQEIALHGAKLAADQLDHPVMREDHGFNLNAFPGWPGPYMNHTERFLKPQDLLSLLAGKDRTGYFVMALAYVDPKGETIEVTSQLPIRILEEVRSGQNDFGWDPVISIADDDRALSEYPQADRYPLFADNFVQLAKKLGGN